MLPYLNSSIKLETKLGSNANQKSSFISVYISSSKYTPNIGNLEQVFLNFDKIHYISIFFLKSKIMTPNTLQSVTGNFDLD